MPNQQMWWPKVWGTDSWQSACLGSLPSVQQWEASLGVSSWIFLLDGFPQASPWPGHHQHTYWGISHVFIYTDVSSNGADSETGHFSSQWTPEL